ncbi:hypothetical protein ACIPLC_07935 [Kitasatospora sp. NPDC086801]|uniref:hypothetical protein n=1 Tax=Kitasatospora sp. NPDC086801 TaxID=3364066 RepID=UPI00380FB287
MDTAHALADRLLNVDWSPLNTDPRLRISLMREFLRRSALWAHQLESGAWPFFDVAALIDPSVRADPGLVEQVSKSCALQHPAVQQTCVGALHFAALQETSESPFQLPNPFEPIVSLFENGGGFALDGTGMIDIDIDASMSKGRLEGRLEDWLEDWLEHTPPTA